MSSPTILRPLRDSDPNLEKGGQCRIPHVPFQLTGLSPDEATGHSPYNKVQPRYLKSPLKRFLFRSQAAVFLCSELGHTCAVHSANRSFQAVYLLLSTKLGKPHQRRSAEEPICTGVSQQLHAAFLSQLTHAETWIYFQLVMLFGRRYSLGSPETLPLCQQGSQRLCWQHPHTMGQNSRGDWVWAIGIHLPTHVSHFKDNAITPKDCQKAKNAHR